VILGDVLILMLLAAAFAGATLYIDVCARMIVTDDSSADEPS